VAEGRSSRPLVWHWKISREAYRNIKQPRIMARHTPRRTKHGGRSAATTEVQRGWPSANRCLQPHRPRSRRNQPKVERRLKIARVEARQKARAGKKEAQTNSDWQVAADALTDLKSKGYELGSLKKEQLLALVRVLGAGKAQGNKPELAALLTERFGNITSRQFQQIQTTVQRGLALTLLPPPPVAPLPLTEPVQALAEPPAPAEQEQLSLAQRRSRR